MPVGDWDYLFSLFSSLFHHYYCYYVYLCSHPHPCLVLLSFPSSLWVISLYSSLVYCFSSLMCPCFWFVAIVVVNAPSLFENLFWPTLSIPLSQLIFGRFFIGDNFWFPTHSSVFFPSPFTFHLISWWFCIRGEMYAFLFDPAAPWVSTRSSLLLPPAPVRIL